MPSLSKTKKASSKDIQPIKDADNNPLLSKAREVALDLIKSYGEGAVHYSGAPMPSVKFSSSGSLVVDQIIGGGIPEGRLIEIYGKESSGKSTIAMAIAAQCVARGKPVMYIDFEQAFDPVWAKINGLDKDNPLVFMAQPETAENGFDIIHKCLKSGVFGLIILDSVASMTVDKQLTAEIGAESVGLLARFLSVEIRRLVPLLKESGTTAIFINQLREKVSMGGMPSWGDTEITPGGRALKHYASVRLNVSRVAKIKRGADEVIGATTKIKCDKNKVSAPFRSGETAIMFDSGLSILTEIINASVSLGLIEKRGAFYKMGDVTLGQGVEAVRKALRANQDLAYSLHQQICAAWGMPPLEYRPIYEPITQYVVEIDTSITHDKTARHIDDGLEITGHMSVDEIQMYESDLGVEE